MGRKLGSALAAVALVGGCPSDDPGDAGMGAADTDGGPAIVQCGDDIPEFATGLEAIGDSQRYRVRLLDALPSPPERYINRWSVAVLDLDREPVPEADLYEVEAFMPVHGHDGRVPTVIEPLDDPGEFDVDDINLWMRGPWEVRFRIRGDAGEDYVVFDVCVEG